MALVLAIVSALLFMIAAVLLLIGIRKCSNVERKLQRMTRDVSHDRRSDPVPSYRSSTGR